MVDVAAASKDTIYVALGVSKKTVYQSKDAGSTWQAMSDGLEWGKFIPYYSQLDYSDKGGKERLFLATFAENPEVNPLPPHPLPLPRFSFSCVRLTLQTMG